MKGLETPSILPCFENQCFVLKHFKPYFLVLWLTGDLTILLSSDSTPSKRGKAESRMGSVVGTKKLAAILLICHQKGSS